MLTAYSVLGSVYSEYCMAQFARFAQEALEDKPRALCGETIILMKVMLRLVAKHTFIIQINR